MAVLALLLVTSVALQLVNPQILRFFIDTATSDGPMRVLQLAALAFLAVALVQQGVAVAATVYTQRVGWTATNALRTELAAHCLRLDLSFHRARRPGELIERIDGDVSLLFSFFTTLVVSVLANVALVAGVLVLLFREDWRVGAALAFFFGAALAALVWIRALAIPTWRAEREADAGFFGFLGEHVANSEDVRANGATGHVMRRFLDLLRAWLPLQRKASLMAASMWMTTLLTFALGNAVAFGVGGTLYGAGAISIGTVYLIFHYTELLRRPVEQIRRQLVELQEAEACIDRVEELRATRSRLADGTGPPLPPGALPVTADGVDFAYDASEPVLRDASFELPAGAVLGVAGRTGSGKTTLARLLARLADPDRGEIRLGGRALPTVPLSELRRRVVLVTQEVQLFHADVRANLTFFDPSVPDEALAGALEEVGLGPWLRALPAGLDTPLADGAGLSAGQAQLLALARAFLRDPDLVILDEAASRMDPATAQRLERATARLLSGRTGVVIAHRLGALRCADRILVLEGGRVLEHGERDLLLRDPGSQLRRLAGAGEADGRPA